MTELAITFALVAKHNLAPKEYAHVKQILGREQGDLRLGGVGGRNALGISRAVVRIEIAG